MRASVWIGVGVGVMTGLWMWAEYGIGLHTTRAELGRYTGFFSIIFPIAGVIMALRIARAGSDPLTFRTGFPHVFVLSIMATLAMTAMSWAYIYWLNPQWLAETGISATAFILQGAVAALLGGVIIGLVVLLFMRTRVAVVSSP